MLKRIAELKKRLQIHFDDERLITQAFMHKSFLKEHRNLTTFQNNERLEFLGDTVIDLAVKDLLYRKYPDAKDLPPKKN